MVSASGKDYYPSHIAEPATEDAAPGGDFLARLCVEWERAAMGAEALGARVCIARFSVVLSKDGGALAKMLPAFRLGVGGKLGPGTQRMPWISLVDAVGVIRFALSHTELAGPVNAVAPESVTNAELSQTLGRVLGRPVMMPVPGFMLKAAMGQMADEMLLSGANVRPRRLEVAGYRFEYPRLVDAFEALFPRRSSPPAQASS
jgi:uncharacterized protein (TIGR01777 family)